MHDADLEFQLPQTGRRFAGQQSAAHDDDRFLQVRHFAQGERVANRSEIDDIAQSHSRDWRPHGTAAHRQAGLVKFDRLAISEDREPPVDIHLRDHRSQTRLDFVRVVPARIEMRQFLQRRCFVPEKALREHPALIGMVGFRADEGDAAPFVVFPDAFARAPAADAAADDEIVALNHVKGGR